MKHPQRWDLPKGHLDQSETKIEAAFRELKEGTGIEPTQIWRDPDFEIDRSTWFSTLDPNCSIERTDDFPGCSNLRMWKSSRRASGPPMVRLVTTSHPSNRRLIDPLLGRSHCIGNNMVCLTGCRPYPISHSRNRPVVHQRIGTTPNPLVMDDYIRLHRRGF